VCKKNSSGLRRTAGSGEMWKQLFSISTVVDKKTPTVAVRGMERGAMSSYANARWNGCDGRECAREYRKRENAENRWWRSGLRIAYSGETCARRSSSPTHPHRARLRLATNRTSPADRWPVTAECLIILIKYVIL